MPQPDEPASEPGVQAFFEEPAEDLEQWAAVWEADRTFPIASHRGGLAGRLIVFFKRLARPLVRAPLADLWERQRVFNQILIARQIETNRVLESLGDDLSTVGKDLQQVQQEVLSDIRAIQNDINGNVRELSDDLDDFRRKGLIDVMRHTDALFSRLDQKLDRVRRNVQRLADRNREYEASGDQ